MADNVPAPNTTNQNVNPTSNQQIPKLGPATIPLPVLDFSVNTSYIVDLTSQINQGKIEYIQGLYVDNSLNANVLTITNLTTQQVVKFPPLAEGYIPFLAQNPPRFKVATAAAGSLLVTIYAYNVPIGPIIWITNPAGVTYIVSDAILDATVNNNKVGIQDRTVAAPLGYQQITSLSTATALTVPGGANLAIIECETQSVRWRDDGTAPTASVGMLLATGSYFIYNGNLSAIEFIQTTASASLSVSYYAV